jgi:membrane-associated phospholipid phosphatase
VGLGRFAWAGCLGAAAVAVGLAATKGEDGPAVDRELFDLLNRGAPASAETAFAAVTELGSFYASGSAAAALVVLGHRGPAVRAVSAAGATWLLLQGLKRVANRPRPADADPEGVRMLIARPPASSWPSSHPAVLTSFTRVASRELGVARLGRAAFGVLDLSVGASRVALGVHYPSDVVSGLLLGRAVARVWPRSHPA